MAQEEEVQKQEKSFIADLKQIVHAASRMAYSAINFAQVEENRLIGQRIVMQEQKGKQWAEYGKHIIKLVSQALTAEFGKGFSERSLWKFKQFYLLFNDLIILPTVSAEFAKSFYSLPKLSWSHYERLERVTDTEARNWYIREAEAEMWAYRTLDRNINSQYYELNDKRKYF